MKYLKNLFQSKYFRPIIAVFFVAVASIFTGYFIVNGANYMSSNFLNIDSGGAYIYGNPSGNGLIVANGNVGIGDSNPISKLVVDGIIKQKFYIPSNATIFSAPTERQFGGSMCVTSNRLKVFRVPGPGGYRVRFDIKINNASDYVWAYLLCGGVRCSDELVYNYFNNGNLLTYQTKTLDTYGAVALHGQEIELQTFAAETIDKTCSGSQNVMIRNVYLQGDLTSSLNPGVVVD